MNASPPRLFVPGDGALPPALAGRSAQQAVLSRCLSDMVRGAAPPHNVVLVGPRGNGKTALLNWFKATCESASGVDVVSLTPGEIADAGGLTDAVVPRRGIARLLPRKAGIASVGSAEWSPSQERNFKRALLAHCRRKPLALLLDEAHTLDLGLGSLLLNASQQVRAEAPFLLVLAGTPGLSAHLGAMDASFWSRLGAGLLGVGRLDPAAARTALVEPLQAHDVRIEEDALEAVVEDSQRYPYFLQLWGDALWQRHLATGASDLTAETRCSATSCSRSRRRGAAGGGRLGGGLLPEPLHGVAWRRSDLRSRRRGAAVSQSRRHGVGTRVGRRACRNRPRGGRRTIRHAGGLEPPRLRLVSAGPRRPDGVECGIPSLMNYVLDQAGESPAGGN